jgi:hypothetical protein
VVEQLISLKKAAENSGYHPDYLGYLIRKGKLEGKKIGHNWFTTEKAVKKFLASQKFLPLKDFLFSWAKPKLILVLLVTVISIGIIVVYFSSSPVYYQYLSGDFVERTKSIPSQLTEEKIIKEVRITNYISDNFGETEVTAQIKPESVESEEKPSFFQQIINFFKSDKE